ncbi:hypothetical protein A3734_06430 [Sulfitobacter sp. HI0054]|uniref:hypothetical protein n=1 Tax=Sulfitobacter sp. HI0054 TaxID=1822238 RepID=UPI0007C378CF|nr:hypothetical protein [Sulfitobacter sp. HI0054]KZY50992.1 hypothetical protein A3734_06430 [Sulfitobacter sp. HI0054]
MSKVDISSEAVERLVQAVAVDAVAVSATTIVTLRAQAERIKELEGQKANIAKVCEGYREQANESWRKAKTARNDALRNVRAIAKRYDDEATCMSCADTVGILREIDALIEGATND